MQWRTIGTTFFIASLILCCMVIPVLPARGETRGVAQAEPSPRPPLPTATPRSRHTNKPKQVGRITGTIIENSTGVPAAGILVDIDGVIVISDQHGNYERYVPVGAHTVDLALGDQGSAQQPPQTVHVTANHATIQHLRYTAVREAVMSTPMTTATPTPPGTIPGS